MINDNVTLKDQSLVFKSHVGSGCVMGEKSAILHTILAPGMIIPNRVVYQNGVFFGEVEW